MEVKIGVQYATRELVVETDASLEDVEQRIVATEAPGIAPEIVTQLVAAGRKARTLKDHGLDEATSVAGSNRHDSPTRT